MSMFCQHCGNGLHTGAQFCSRCGAPVTVAQPIPGRPLIRPRAGRIVAGVCLALAQANGWDVVLVRILTAVGFLLSSGFLGIAYLAAWVGIPEETPPVPGAYDPRSI